MRGTDSNLFTWSATGAGSIFELHGGLYVLAGHATWGGGNAQLQVLGPDGATWLNAASSITADGATTTAYLAPGEYRWNITTTTAGSVSVARVPFE